MSNILIIETCLKFRKYKGSKWVKTNEKCPRDGEAVWQEVKSSGERTNHFGCSRSGCTHHDNRS